MKFEQKFQELDLPTGDANIGDLPVGDAKLPNGDGKIALKIEGIINSIN